MVTWDNSGTVIQTPSCYETTLKRYTTNRGADRVPIQLKNPRFDVAPFWGTQSITPQKFTETQQISYLSAEAALVDIQFPGNEINVSFLRGPDVGTIKKKQIRFMYAH